MLTRFLLVILAGLWCGATDVRGEASELQKKFALPDRVQLLPFQVPFESPTRSGLTPVTIFIKPFHKEDVGRVCRHSPRIRDAILGTLYAEPLKAEGRELLPGGGKRLIGPVNEALGAKIVEDIYVAQGALNMASGSISKLPFTSASGCTSIKEMEYNGKIK
ncbi:MAG: hypothetical protein ACPGNT_03025 [Rhodospirillales bacterium]